MTAPAHLLELPGLTPTPLGNYLAGLGLLRAVGKTHADARGWWRGGEVFCLRGPLDAAGLTDYLLTRWEPSVFTRPWEPDPEQDRAVLDALPAGWAAAREVLRFSTECVETSLQAKRFGKEAKARKDALDEGGGTAAQKKARLKEDRPYQELRARQEGALRDLDRRRLRSRCPEASLAGFDAALVAAGGEDSLLYGPLLGSGGNDGRRDFMLAYLRQLRNVLADEAASRGWLALALGLPGQTPPPLPPVSGNSWFPDSVKLHNSGQERFFSEQPASPWAYLLACEGVQLLAGSASRRLGSAAEPAAVFPFTLRAASPPSREEAGKEKFEFWAPLWVKPATLAEVAVLLKQGRSSLRGRPALRPHQMAQAVLSRGVQHGVAEFQRHALLHTNSANTFEAVPRGRYRVGGAPPEAASCLAELRPWYDRLPRDASKVVRGFRRQVEDAILGACERPAEPERWLRLLVTCAQVDSHTDRSKSLRKNARPVPPLSLRWLARVVGEGRGPDTEFVVAASIASVRGTQAGPGGARRSPLRENVFGVRVREGRRPEDRSWAAFTDQPSNRAAWSGLDLLADLTEILRRRCLDSPLTRPLALGATYPCPPDVLALFAAGRLDDRRIQELVPALSLLNWEQVVPIGEGGEGARPPARGPAGAALSAAAGLQERRPLGVAALPALCYLKPLLQPDNFLIDPRRMPGLRAFGDRRFPPRAPEALAALVAGDLPRAVEQATARLRSCGLRPVALPLHPPDDSRRLAAALLVPWGREGLRLALRRITEVPARQR